MTELRSRFQDVVEDARQRIRETDVGAIRERIERGDRFHVVDVREESEWTRGHIPGATHLGKGVIERDVERAIPDLKAEIVLYCGGGARSALAADSLQKMGYTNVWSMDGGFGAWVRAGYAVEAGRS